MSERIHLGPEGIQVEDELSGKNMDLMRVYYPMLIFDGLKETSVRVEDNRAWLSLDGRGVEYEVAAPKGVMLKRSGRSLKSRNGMVEPLYGDAAGMKVCYVIRAFEDRT